MAISPMEAGTLTEADSFLLAVWEARIDNVLRESTSFGNLASITTDGLKTPVREELIRRYTKAGWNVRYVSDQHEGDFLTFTPTRGGR